MVATTRAALARHLGRTNKATGRVLKTKLTEKKSKAVKQSQTSVIVQWYNEVAGQSDIRDAAVYDRYGNPSGREYDLGRDGSFHGFHILIGQFNDAAMQLPINELLMKGFQVKRVRTEDECIKELESNFYQIAWIISTNQIQNSNFTSALTSFHSKGGSIFLFADNIPYISHASQFLQAKFGLTLDGDYYGGQTMTYKENGHLHTGKFGQHQIFTGISNVFEGITICHPVYSTELSRKVFLPLATGSDGSTSIAVYDPPQSSTEGRICLDCGFTKLYINWDSAGTARDILNTSCWLSKL